jgi:hypothetical protein
MYASPFLACNGPLTTSQASHPSANPNALRLDPNSDIVSTRVNGICAECMVLSAQADITDSRGEKKDVSSGVYSHHILMATIGRPMVVMPIVVRCADGTMGGFRFGGGAMGAMGAKGHAGTPMTHGKRQIGGTPGPIKWGVSILLGQGDDGTAMTYMTKGQKVKAGYYLSKTDSTNLMSEVINYKNEPQEFYVTLDYEYIPNMPTRPKEYLDVGLGAINVQPCGLQNLKTDAAKATKYTSPPWDVAGDGYLLDLKPHLHDGGLNVTFYVNGKASCTSNAIYGTSGAATIGNGEKWETIGAYTPCTEPIPIKKGDKLTMDAWYDLTKHRLRPQSNDHSEGAEAMAMVLFTFARPPL